MKKNKHKWKYRIDIRKKLLVLIILGVLVFVGVGYAIIESNLGMTGTLEVSKYSKTLYGAMQKEVNNGYALKYTGSHQDSMDPTKSTKDIYHFYGSTAQKGTDILNKNNVVFAGFCWQMIRTTDTGGVKLLYNGEPEEIIVDGETRLNCGDTRNYYKLGGIIGEKYLASTYVYAKNYTATTSGTTTTFKLVDDPDDPDDYKSITVNSDTAENQINDIAENYPYTCMNTSGTCKNNNFYKINSYSNGVYANVYYTTLRDRIGMSNFSSASNSPTYVGYMYGDIYPMTYSVTRTQSVYFVKTNTVLSSTSFANTYKYSKILNLTGTSTVYELDNPILGSDITDPDYSGYNTYRSATTVSGGSPYYLVGRNGTGTNYYYVRLSSNKTLTDFNIMVGDSLEDNGDNTYTIKNGTNQATEVTVDDWYANYANYAGYYTCGDANDTCEQPKYIINTTITNYKYVDNVTEKITIAKTRNGLDISEDYVTISKVDWYNGYDTTYSDYVYTCGNTDTVCTTENLSYITSRSAEGFTYALNHYYGASVKYEDNKYILQDPIPLEYANDMTALSTHHYVCPQLGATECSSVEYVYSNSGPAAGKLYHIELSDPNITSIQDAIDAMFTKNTNNSVIKNVVENWYELKLYNTIYESKIDDTVYCGDRSYRLTHYYNYGWNPNGGSLANYNLYLGANELDCANITDRYSVSNNAAKIKYKVGLATEKEMSLLNQQNARKATSNYWLISPTGVDYGSRYFAAGRYVDQNGLMRYNELATQQYGVRPVISLVKGISYSAGNGEMTNPYIVDMSN